MLLTYSSSFLYWGGGIGLFFCSWYLLCFSRNYNILSDFFIRRLDVQNQRVTATKVLQTSCLAAHLVLPTMLRHNLFSLVFGKVKIYIASPRRWPFILSLSGEPKIDFRSKSICALNLSLKKGPYAPRPRPDGSGSAPAHANAIGEL